MWCAICGGPVTGSCACPPASLAAHRAANEWLLRMFTDKYKAAVSAEEQEVWWNKMTQAEHVLLDMEKDAAGFMALVLSNGHGKLRSQLSRFPQ